jgi:hypothetical protein
VYVTSDAITTLKIKIKVGDNEFEAEGPPDAVQAQLLTFVRLVGREEKAEEKPARPIESPSQPPLINKIARVDGKVVSLKVKIESPGDAVLVLLLGQQQLRRNTAVAGTEIMDGLRASGHGINRADFILKRYASSGDIVATGKRRRRRYRLTTDGVEKAQKIVRTLAAALPPVEPGGLSVTV